MSKMSLINTLLQYEVVHDLYYKNYTRSTKGGKKKENLVLSGFFPWFDVTSADWYCAIYKDIVWYVFTELNGFY